MKPFTFISYGHAKFIVLAEYEQILQDSSNNVEVSLHHVNEPLLSGIFVKHHYGGNNFFRKNMC